MVLSAIFFQFYISDEHPASSGRRRNVAQKTFNVNVENNSGQVVFGAKRASIEDAPLNHPTGISIMSR